MACCGIVSGLATQLWAQFGLTQYPTIYGTSVWPGIFFGLAISYGAVRWGGMSYRWVVPLVVIVIASWVGASEFSDATFSSSLNKVAAYIISGVLGSAGTASGVLLFSKVGRKLPLTLLLLAMIAGVGSTLLVSPLYFLVGSYINWFVFPLWQGSVSAAVGLSLAMGSEK